MRILPSSNSSSGVLVVMMPRVGGRDVTAGKGDVGAADMVTSCGGMGAAGGPPPLGFDGAIRCGGAMEDGWW